MMELLHITFLGAFAYISMTISEIVSRCYNKSKNKTNFQQNIENSSVSSVAIHCLKNNMVISNLIPFKNLNLIFALGIALHSIMKIIQTAQLGVPKLSIQATFMLLCFLFSNSKAKHHFYRKLAALRGQDQPVDRQRQAWTVKTTNSQHRLGPESRVPEIKIKVKAEGQRQGQAEEVILPEDIEMCPVPHISELHVSAPTQLHLCSRGL